MRLVETEPLAANASNPPAGRLNLAGYSRCSGPRLTMRQNTAVGKVHDNITDSLREWIERQHLFFVATAPVASDGLVNCSPKGLDSLSILGPREVAYVDLTGSGAETIAHVRENGRIVLMFCAFEGPPTVVRLHGMETVVTKTSAAWDRLRAGFPDYLAIRAIISIDVTRVSDSCGYAVPLYDFRSDRETLLRWSENKGAEGLEQYRRQKNVVSINGLPALE